MNPLISTESYVNILKKMIDNYVITDRKFSEDKMWTFRRYCEDDRHYIVNIDLRCYDCIVCGLELLKHTACQDKACWTQYHKESKNNFQRLLWEEDPRAPYSYD